MKKQLLLTAASVLSCVLLSNCASSGGQDVSSLLAKSDQGWASLSDYDRGKHCLEIGDYGSAIEAFAAELGHDPQSVRALNGEAVAYDRIGRRDVAQHLFERALTIDANSAETLNNFAFFHLRYGETKEAAELSRRASAVVASLPAGSAPEVLARVIDNNEALIAQQASQKQAVVAQAADPKPLAKGDDGVWNLDVSKSPMTFSPLAKLGDVEQPLAHVETAPVALQPLPPAAAPEKVAEIAATPGVKEATVVPATRPLAAPVVETRAMALTAEASATPPSAAFADQPVVPETELALPAARPLEAPKLAAATNAPRMAMNMPVTEFEDLVLPSAPRPIAAPMLAASDMTSPLHPAIPVVEVPQLMLPTSVRPLERPALAALPYSVAANAPVANVEQAPELVLPTSARPLAAPTLASSSIALSFRVAATEPTAEIPELALPDAPRPLQPFAIRAPRLAFASRPPVVNFAEDAVVPDTVNLPDYRARAVGLPTVALPQLAWEFSAVAPAVDFAAAPAPYRLYTSPTGEVVAVQVLPTMSKFGPWYTAALVHDTVAKPTAIRAGFAPSHAGEARALVKHVAKRPVLKRIARAPEHRQTAVAALSAAIGKVADWSPRSRIGRLQIADASPRHDMARHVQNYLASRGVEIGRVKSAHYSQSRTKLFYHGDRRRAEAVAALLPVQPKLCQLRGNSDAIELVLGSDITRAQLAARQPRRVRLTER